MTVALRSAADADLTPIGQLHHRSRSAAYTGLVSPAGLAAGSGAAMGAWWTERWRWERDTHRLTVAVVPGRSTIAGFSYVGPSETPAAVELYAIHVDPDLVGTGVGQALMIGALTELAALAGDPPTAPQRAVLWVLRDNLPARRFYERGGWIADGASREAPVGPDLVPQVRYARSLTTDVDGRPSGGLVGGNA